VFVQICDNNRNGTLDIDEFEKCCRLNNLGLSGSDVALLHRYFDRDHSGGVGYEEFLRAVRGRLSPVRKQSVKKIFDVLDKCACADNVRCEEWRSRQWRSPSLVCSGSEASEAT
jgi:Ca2+-binding EF-hand superfamily protein